MNRSTAIQSFLRIFSVACVAAGWFSQAQDDEKTSDSKLEPQIALLIEYFEVDHRTANKLIRDYSPKAADAQGLRDRLGEMIKGGEATLSETVWFRSRSGQRAKSESIRETIYPTEYDPPEIPNTLGVVPAPTKAKPGEKAPKQPTLPPAVAGNSSWNGQILMTSATPTAFETRNIGTTVEADSVISEDGELVSISIAPEIISLEGREFLMRPDSKNVPWGSEHLSMPLFYAMKTSIQFKAQPGNYNLMGLFTPPGRSGKKIIGLIKMELIFAN